MVQRIAISGKINDDTIADFTKLFAIYEQAETAATDVMLDFTNAQFLRQNAVAFLGGMIRVLQRRGLQVSWQPPVNQAVRESLQKNGFSVTFFAEPTYKGSAPVVSYREDLRNDFVAIRRYLNHEWLRPEWIDVDDNLRHDIISKMHEIFGNVFAHARSPVGGISCGQYYRTLTFLKLTVVDFGVGIPQNVRNYRPQEVMTDADTLVWALQDRHSTADDLFARGLGLGVLRDFVIKNHGKLEIFSGEGYLCIDNNGQKHYNIGQRFHGTLVNITLNCDGVRYLSAEDDNGNEDINANW